jgi:aspartate kinase
VSLSKKESLLVVKVGGSVIESTADLRRVASAIAGRRRAGGRILVVASALQGVTDRLAQAPGATLDELCRRHLDIARELAAEERVREALDELEKLIDSIRLRGEPTDSIYARLLSFGERLSVLLLEAAIAETGHDARAITAEEAGLRAEGPPRAGFCDLPASAAGFRRMHRELRERILVLTGFYGIDGEGRVVLFGRGGSDNTACAVAAGLDADRLELWKDVPGFMSADPREVRGARLIEEISFDEVAQMGAYGSRIVNHGCLTPLRGRNTRIFISSIQGAGTRLVERPRRGAAQVVALASRKGNNGYPALIGAVGDGIAGDPGIRSRMLSFLAAAGVRGDLVALPSGSSGLSCAVHPDDLAPALSGLHEGFFA